MEIKKEKYHEIRKNTYSITVKSQNTRKRKKEYHEQCEALKKELADLKKQHEKSAPVKSSRSRKSKISRGKI